MAEGWGEATNWQPDFSWQVPSEPYLSMAEGRGEASDWLSNFCSKYNEDYTCN